MGIQERVRRLGRAVDFGTTAPRSAFPPVLLISRHLPCSPFRHAHLPEGGLPIVVARGRTASSA